MKELDKKYNFKEVEKKWQKYWQDENIFTFDWNDTKNRNKIFAIDTPPPHVSGALHMGHIFGYTQMDVIARFQRMLGKNVFYPFGFDDNGLPSERYVEKKLGKKSKSMARQEFVKICDKEIREAELYMKDNAIEFNYSFDFNEEYRTISATSRKVSQMSFLDLYNKGVLERKEEPVIWDVVDQTALAQTEAEDKELESQMNYIKFGLVSTLYSFESLDGTIASAFSSPPPLEGWDARVQSTPNLNKVSGPSPLEGWDAGVQSTTNLNKVSSPSPLEGEGLGWGVQSTTNLNKISSPSPLEGWDARVQSTPNLNKVSGPSPLEGWDARVQSTPNLNNNKNTILNCEKENNVNKYSIVPPIPTLPPQGGKDQGVGNSIVPPSPTLPPQGGKDQGVGNSIVPPIPTLPPQGGKDQIAGNSASSYNNNQGGSDSKGNAPHQNSDAVLTPPQGGSDSKGKPIENLTIMTTRPELIPACVAIFAHPDDREKYENKIAITPLGVEVPILFDDSVEKDKGTGVMMCCTFGDNADVEKYKKYNLPLKIIINENGCLYFDNVVIAEKYRQELNGLFVDKARQKILEILESEGKIVKVPEKILHNVKVGERSKSALEIIVKKQWNIKVLDIKEELHKKAREINWYPAWMEARMHSWIDGLNWNWCISRQRFFGVPVPCWYSNRKGEEGKVLLPTLEQLPIDPTVDLPIGYSADEIMGDGDVFDTWMTSSVAPQLSTQGFNEKLCCDLERFKALDIPFDLRPQGHDIIRTWAFCTLVKAHYHENKIPWKNIFINGFCLASDGKKMSKSVGNVIDPIKAIREFSADAVRYWASCGSAGTDTNYSIDVIKNGQKLITKLFNASKFAQMHFKNLEENTTNACDSIKNGLIFEEMDLWIISRIKTVINNAEQCFNSYEYNKALEVIEYFFWSDLCDNYLEIVKVRCYGASGTKYEGKNLTIDELNIINKAQKSAIYTIYYIFNAILKLFASYIPCICEEIFSCLYEEEFNKMKSISARGMWPNQDYFVNNPEIEKIGDEVLKIITNVRKFKSEKNISIKEIIETWEVDSSVNLNNVMEDLKNVCNIETIKVNV